MKSGDIFPLLAYLEAEMRRNAAEGHVSCEKTLVMVAGRQADDHLVFLSPLHIVDIRTGQMAAPEDVDNVWIADWPMKGSPRQELAHSIYLPVDSNLTSLRAFIEEAIRIVDNNFPAAFLAWAAMYMLHFYDWTIANIRHFNMPLLFGAPTVGKTLIASCAAWLNGCSELHIASRATLAYLTNVVTQTSLPFVWDDPASPDDVGKLAVDLANGAIRGKADDEPRPPHTGCLVTANFCLTGIVRFYSRLCVIPVEPLHRRKETGDAKRLEAMARGASATLPWAAAD